MCKDLCCHLVPKLPWSWEHFQSMFARYLVPLVILFTVFLNLVTCRISILWKPFPFPISLLQELRLCSHLISEFGSESSTMTTDGVFSTTWLNNLPKSMDSPLLPQENAHRNNCDAHRFFTQLSSVPKSVLQLLGSSYIMRSTAWEMYGRWINEDPSILLVTFLCMTFTFW
jgi:hypothetical protein